jgi:hypothetical protein
VSIPENAVTPNEINATLFELWDKHGDPMKDRYVPLVCGQPTQGGLVFVGFNPPFSDEGWVSLIKKWRETAKKPVNPKRFFRWHTGMRLADFDVPLALEIAAHARRHFVFFRPYRDLAANLNMEWEYLNLFAYQSAKQADAEARLFKKPVYLHELNEFGARQVELFRELLPLTRPRVVIVASGLAGHVYRKHWKPTFSQDDGYYFDRIGEVSVPIFFSGMLTGQRASDAIARDRLHGQVARALGRQWPPPQ